MGYPANLLQWSGWRPLGTASRDPEIPHSPGLYRVRRVGRHDLDYIGQTGMGTMNLRKRLGMLRGVYGELMPYRDPHTAGTALWALYHQTGEEFESRSITRCVNRHWNGRECARALASRSC
jgi:hypothetical protein